MSSRAHCDRCRRRLYNSRMARAFLYLLVVTSLASAEAGFPRKLSEAALERTRHPVRYDPAYVKIPYPGGDVPADQGVCTDVVIRSLRALGVDLQKEVHEDMRDNFSQYPSIFGLKKPDPNIDHRRVANLRVFFRRKAKSLPPSDKGSDYLPGEIVTWLLPGGREHIGIVTHEKTFLSGIPKVVHNIGEGDVLENVLFEWKVTDRFRYEGPTGH